MFFGSWKNFLRNGKKTNNILPHILIIDDEESCISTLELMLHDMLIKIEGICNQQQLTEYLSNHSFSEIDLLMLDMVIPDIDSLDIMRKAKSHQIPVIVQTGLVEHETVKDALKIGAAGYMVKPYVREDIVNLLSKYIKLEKKTKITT